jgi:hypothetical protein
MGRVGEGREGTSYGQVPAQKRLGYSYENSPQKAVRKSSFAYK